MNENKRPPNRCDSHVWVSTASPLIERCGRAGCKAMRQCVKGTWTEPQAATPKPVATTVNQPGLWA